MAFIDFEKALDSRKLVWPILKKNGVTEKLYRCIRSMYETIEARVKCGAQFTECINCTKGVKQGDVCPFIFHYLLA